MRLSGRACCALAGGALPPRARSTRPALSRSARAATGSAHLDHAHRRIVALQTLLAGHHHGVSVGHTFGDLHTPGAADTNFDLGALRHQAFAIDKHWGLRRRRSACATTARTYRSLRAACSRCRASATRCRAGLCRSRSSDCRRFFGDLGQVFELLFGLLHHFDDELATALRHDGLLGDRESRLFDMEHRVHPRKHTGAQWAIPLASLATGPTLSALGTLPACSARPCAWIGCASTRRSLRTGPWRPPPSTCDPSSRRS